MKWGRKADDAQDEMIERARAALEALDGLDADLKRATAAAEKSRLALTALTERFHGDD